MRCLAGFFTLFFRCPPILDVDKRRTASVLAQDGVRVHFDSPQVMTHNKILALDKRHIYPGTIAQAALRLEKKGQS